MRKLWDGEATAQPAWSSRERARKVSSVLQGGHEGEQHMGQSLESREPPRLAGTKSVVAHYGPSASHPHCTWWAWIRSMLSSPRAAWPAELSKGSSGLREPGSRWRKGMGMGRGLLQLEGMGKESHL